MIEYKKLNDQIKELIPHYCEPLPEHGTARFIIDNTSVGISLPEKKDEIVFTLSKPDYVTFISNNIRFGVYRCEINKNDIEQFYELSIEEKRRILLNLVSDVEHKKLKDYNITNITLKLPGLDDVIRLSQNGGVEFRFCFLYKEK